MLRLDTQQTLVPDEALNKAWNHIEREVAAMQRVVDDRDDSHDYASLNLPSDSAMHERVIELAGRFGSAETIVLVGMGGPGLGAKAMQESLTGTMHNQLESKKIFYADTVDAKRIGDIRTILDTDLKAGKQVLVIVCTQSGTTTESIANMQVFEAVLEQHGADLSQSMVVITNEGSKLDAFAAERSIDRLLVPPKIGGRYSALSSLGLFPLALLGIDIKAVATGALEMRTVGLATDVARNLPAQSAAAIHYQYTHGKNVLVNFMCSPDLESLGLWCRQVMAESLGKAKDRHEQTVHVGMTPTVDVGSRDLHSMFQLYMEGPDDKFTSFVRWKQRSKLTVPAKPEFDALTSNIGGRGLAAINHAINEGVLHAFAEVKRPFSVIDIDEGSASDLGAFLQFKMIETMFLGCLLSINPFDQPGVELYKTEMKRIMAEG